MSEVYIRSQNKEKLYRLGGNYACVEYGEYEDIKKKRGGAEADKKRHVICISDGCLEEIGEYATKERCLEVLDEIQKVCVKHGNDRKGDKSKVRYATIGFVAEYGTSSHAARPYMTVANEKAHEKVVEAQRSIWESETGE